jgi:hypothetical protein
MQKKPHHECHTNDVVNQKSYSIRFLTTRVELQRNVGCYEG